jgi:hypothetical protein
MADALIRVAMVETGVIINKTVIIIVAVTAIEDTRFTFIIHPTIANLNIKSHLLVHNLTIVHNLPFINLRLFAHLHLLIHLHPFVHQCTVYVLPAITAVVTTQNLA